MNNTQILNYSQLFIYQEQETCNTFGILPQPYWIICISLLIQFLIEFSLHTIEKKYQRWKWNNKLRNNQSHWTKFFSCNYENPQIDINILNYPELVITGGIEKAKNWNMTNISEVKIVIEKDESLSLRTKLEPKYQKEVLIHSILDNVEFNPKFSQGTMYSSIFSNTYLFYQIIILVIQITNILVTFKYTSSNQWLNMINLLYLILNSSGYRTLMALLAKNVTIPFINKYLIKSKIYYLKHNPKNVLDFYYVNENGEDILIDNYEILYQKLRETNPIVKMNDNSEKYELTKRRYYVGPCIEKNNNISNNYYQELKGKYFPNLTLPDLILDTSKKEFSCKKHLSTFRGVLISLASIYYFPFIFVSVILFSLPMLIVYILIPIIIALVLFTISIFYLITIACLQNHTSCFYKSIEYYTSLYVKYMTGFLKRFIAAFVIVTLYNYAIVFYHEINYTAPILEDYYARNTSVYYQCILLDKFNSKLDLLLTYT